MSFNSNRRKVLNESLPFGIRASHARSCALNVATKLSVNREAVNTEVYNMTGVSLHAPADSAALLQAFTYLNDLRNGRATLNV